MNADHLPPHPAGLEQAAKTAAGAPPRRKRRRGRGGQGGNQNARKHGFYSGDLDPAETSELWRIINSEGLAPELALIRVKLRSSLQRDPGNPRVLRDATKLLVKWYSSKSELDRTETAYLKRFIQTILIQVASAKRIDRTLTT